MSKAKINIGTQSKKVGTLDGPITISLEDLSDLVEKISGKKGYNISYEKIAAILAILGVLMGGTWHIACWKTRSECKIVELESRINGVAQAIPTNNSSNHKPSDVKKHGKIMKSFFQGQIGIINKKIVKNKYTSFNLPYLLDHNICEYNSRYINWTIDNPIPKPLFFYRLINNKTSLVSWCIVIGKFNSNKFPKRAFLVSEKVANELGFTLREGIADVDFSIMEVEEWERNEECCNTRNIFFNKK